MLDVSALHFDKGGGLVTVVTQDARSGAVLMVAHADREALERTLATGEMHYRSRTRGLWHKGATSGNVQRVVSLAADCDGDAVLARVVPAGPACHTGAASCFGEEALEADALAALAATVDRRARSAWAASAASPSAEFSAAESIPARGAPPELQATPLGPNATHQTPADGGESSPAAAPPLWSGPSYTQRLLADRNLRLKKLGEEAAELVTACADGDAARAAEEGADLVYHTLVALRALGVTLDDVRRVLANRAYSSAPRAPGAAGTRKTE